MTKYYYQQSVTPEVKEQFSDLVDANCSHPAPDVDLARSHNIELKLSTFVITPSEDDIARGTIQLDRKDPLLNNPFGLDGPRNRFVYSAIGSFILAREDVFSVMGVDVSCIQFRKLELGEHSLKELVLYPGYYDNPIVPHANYSVELKCAGDSSNAYRVDNIGCYGRGPNRVVRLREGDPEKSEQPPSNEERFKDIVSVIRQLIDQDKLKHINGLSGLPNEHTIHEGPIF